MVLSAHQPAYLPWLGYFDKITRSQLFLFLDDVQFEKNSYTNRNRIKTPTGPLWLTVPVHLKDHMSSVIAELRIDNTQNWRNKHLKSIAQNYRKAPRFEECFAKLETLYAPKHERLADLCYDQLKFWLAELGLQRDVIRMRDLPPIESSKSQLVLDLFLHFKAKGYLSGALGRDYLDEASFAERGITIEYQNFQYPTYPQLHGDFMPGLSVLDCWMNTTDVSALLDFSRGSHGG